MPEWMRFGGTYGARICYAADDGAGGGGDAGAAGGAGDGAAAGAADAGAGAAAAGDAGAGAATAGAATAGAGTAGTATTGAAAGASDAKPAFPDDWRQKWAGDDPKALKRLERFASPDAVWKSYTDLEKRVSSGALKRSLPEKASAEEITAWRAENGIPEKADGYFEHLPDGFKPTDADKAELGKFFEHMHAKNASPDLVRAAIEWNRARAEEALAEQAANDLRAKQETEEALRAEWVGPDYRININMINGLFSGAPEGVQERFLNARGADGKPLGSDPATLRFLAHLAREINPAGTVVPGSGADAGKSVASELEGIAKTRRENPAAYWNDSKMQARERDLIAAQEKLKARAA